MSSTTAVMITVQTGMSVLMFALPFQILLLILLYNFWPVKNRGLVN